MFTIVLFIILLLLYLKYHVTKCFNLYNCTRSHATISESVSLEVHKFSIPWCHLENLSSKEFWMTW